MPHLTPEQRAHKAAYARRWRKNNPAKVKEHARRSREKNKDKIRARQRAWADTNQERLRSRAQEYYHRNREQILDRRRARVHRLPHAAYERILAQQGGVCALCASPPGERPLSVDHNHATGAIRGLLCGPCNTGIGHLKDDPALCREAAKYLEHRATTDLRGTAEQSGTAATP